MVVKIRIHINFKIWCLIRIRHQNCADPQHCQWKVGWVSVTQLENELIGTGHPVLYNYRREVLQLLATGRTSCRCKNATQRKKGRQESLKQNLGKSFFQAFVIQCICGEGPWASFTKNIQQLNNKCFFVLERFCMNMVDRNLGNFQHCINDV